MRKKEDMLSEKKSVLSSAVLSGISEVARIVNAFCFNTPTQFPQMFGVAFQVDRFTSYECLRAYFFCTAISDVSDRFFQYLF